MCLCKTITTTCKQKHFILNKLCFFFVSLYHMAGFGSRCVYYLPFLLLSKQAIVKCLCERELQTLAQTMCVPELAMSSFAQECTEMWMYLANNNIISSSSPSPSSWQFTPFNPWGATLTSCVTWLYALGTGLVCWVFNTIQCKTRWWCTLVVAGAGTGIGVCRVLMCSFRCASCANVSLPGGWCNAPRSMTNTMKN